MSEKTKKIERCAVIILTVLLILFTLVYSFFMVIMTGAGLVYNRESYGQNIMHIVFRFYSMYDNAFLSCKICRQ